MNNEFTKTVAALVIALALLASVMLVPFALAHGTAVLSLCLFIWLPAGTIMLAKLNDEGF